MHTDYRALSRFEELWALDDLRLHTRQPSREEIGGKFLDGQRTFCLCRWRPGGDPVATRTEKQKSRPEGDFFMLVISVR